ncbi:O-succinylbenzoic acid synthetase domain protein, partial [Bacteroides fragilis str. 3397 T10]
MGIGECAPLPALSCDDLPDYEDILVKVCRKVEREQGRLDM